MGDIWIVLAFNVANGGKSIFFILYRIFDQGKHMVTLRVLFQINGDFSF